MNDHWSLTALFIIWWSTTKFRCQNKGGKFNLLLCYKFVREVQCSFFYIYRWRYTLCLEFKFSSLSLQYSVYILQAIYTLSVQEQFQRENVIVKSATYAKKNVYIYLKQKSSVKPRMRPSNYLWILFYQNQALGAREEEWLFTWLVPSSSEGLKAAILFTEGLQSLRKSWPFSLK